MAIQWGAWQSSGGISARVGVDISTSTKPTTQTVTARIYYETIGWIQSNYNTLTVSGGHSFNGAVSVNQSTGSVLVKTLTKTFTRPYGTASSQYTAVTFSGLPAGGTPRVTVRYSIPALLYSAPAAPRSTGAVRVSDTSADVSWIFDTTAAAPVSSVYIVRQQDDKGWDYSGASTATGTSGKLRISGMAPGHRYRWAIRGENKDAKGDYGYTIWVYTTPLAPAGVTATRNGSNIDVAWTDANHYPYASFEVYKAGARVATVAAGATTWTDVAPSTSGSHTYEVRAVYGDLRSAFTKSNTIMLLAPPLAPTNLTPDGGYVPDGDALTFAWMHNPADGTGQTQHRIRARKAGGSWVDFPATETAEQSYTGSFESFAGPGDVIEWEVQTRGEHATFGPYSDTASVTVATRPPVSVNSPAANAVVNSSMVAVYASGPVDAFAWTATLTGDGPTQTRTGYCPDGVSAFSAAFSNLRDGGAYTVSVITETEVKSVPATVSFTVDYPQPVPPVVSGEWEEPTGAAMVTMATPARSSVLDTMLADAPELVSQPTPYEGATLWDFTGDDSGLETITGPDGADIQVATYWGGSRNVYLENFVGNAGDRFLVDILIHADIPDSGIFIEWRTVTDDNHAGDSWLITNQDDTNALELWQDGAGKGEGIYPVNSETVAAGWTRYRAIVRTTKPGPYYLAGWFFNHSSFPVRNARISVASISVKNVTDSAVYAIETKGAIPATHMRLETLTSRPGETETWETIDTLPASAAGHTYVDYVARLHDDAIYRATAISSLGTESLPAVLNMGRNAYPANFVQHDDITIRLRYNPGLEYTPERADITLVDLDDGDPVPVAILGPAQRNRVSLSGTLYDEEWATAEQQVRDLEWMAYMGGLVLVRTVDQEPMYGVISGMKISRHLSGTYGVSFNVDRAR